MRKEPEYRQLMDFPNYFVSDTGDIVKKYSNDMTRHLKHQTNQQGYHRVYLYKDNRQYVKCVHRLVAEAFISNPHSKKEVNHKDGNKDNNNARNLEWVTPSENCQHKYNVLGYKNFCPPHHCKPVKCIETNIVYASAKEASRKTGLQQGNISGVARGEQKTAGGYHWRYVEEYHG